MNARLNVLRERTMHRNILILLILALLAIPIAAQSQSGLPDITHEGIEVKAIWITMPDGVRLAADLFMPAEREASDKFPVLFELIPYRKDEGRHKRFKLFSYFIHLLVCFSFGKWLRNWPNSERPNL